MNRRKTILEDILLKSFMGDLNDLANTKPIIDIKSKLSNPDQHGVFGNGNHRYQQPTEKELIAFIDAGVTDVIRLNHEASGYNPMSKNTEKKIVESNGATFHLVDSHDSYVAGLGYVGTKSKTTPLLSNGNCLVHCSWGADRTGYVIGAYLKDVEGWDEDKIWDYTTGFNSWESNNNKLICSKSNDGYAKYLDGFYPLDKWCKKYADESCGNCSKKVLKKLGFNVNEEELNTNS